MSAADLDPSRLATSLRTHAFGRSVEVHEATGSTMDDARRAASADAPHGHLVLADAQTNGRGTHGRSWVSPRGTDLYFSLVTRPKVSLAEIGPLTLAVGLGVADGIALFVDPERVRLKWPNNVYVDGRKCAGILVESRSLGDKLDAVVVGVGINVNRLEFPDEIAAQATSIALALAEPVDRLEVLSRVLERLEAYFDRFVREGAAPIVRAVDMRLLYRGERVRLDDLEGVLVGVDEDGGIRLATESGETTRLAGRLELVNAR